MAMITNVISMFFRQFICMMILSVLTPDRRKTSKPVAREPHLVRQVVLGETTLKNKWWFKKRHNV